MSKITIDIKSLDQQTLMDLIKKNPDLMKEINIFEIMTLGDLIHYIKNNRSLLSELDINQAVPYKALALIKEFPKLIHRYNNFAKLNMGDWGELISHNPLFIGVFESCNTDIKLSTSWKKSLVSAYPLLAYFETFKNF